MPRLDKRHICLQVDRNQPSTTLIASVRHTAVNGQGVMKHRSACFDLDGNLSARRDIFFGKAVFLIPLIFTMRYQFLMRPWDHSYAAVLHSRIIERQPAAD